MHLNTKTEQVESIAVASLEPAQSPLTRGIVGISGWGCAAGSLEPLTFTRASSAEFCYPILE